MSHAVQIAPFILIRTGGEMGVDVSPSFQSTFTFRCRGVCSLSRSFSLSRSLSRSLFLYFTHMHRHTHTHTCTDTHTRSGGLRVEERLPWVTHSDKVLSRWAILIYVNKPCCCCERQRGHRWALVTSAPSLEGKAQTKNNAETHTHTHTHTHTESERKRERRDTEL